LALWQSEYGQSPLVSAVAIPEPNGLILIAASIIGMLSISKR
jgi:hypothetical protein